MKWVTRQHAHVDRIACPWLIQRFVDPKAEFLFVPREKVFDTARATGAIPFDTDGAELHHFRERGEEFVSFDAIVRKYGLSDPALHDLARIVRAADAKEPPSSEEGPGLKAAATGFNLISRDDHENMRLQFPLYDALYAFCQARRGAAERPGPARARGP